MAQTDTDDLQKALEAARAELEETKSINSAIEEELNALLKEREAECKRLADANRELETRLKSLQLECNDLRADLQQQRTLRESAEEKVVAVTQQRNQADKDLERAVDELRRKEHEAARAEKTGEQAEERAIIAEATVTDLQLRVRNLEGDLIHTREELDALKASSARPIPPPPADEARDRQSQTEDAPPKVMAMSSSTREAADTDGQVVVVTQSSALHVSSSSADVVEMGSVSTTSPLSAEMVDVLGKLRALALECRQSRAAYANHAVSQARPVPS